MGPSYVLKKGTRIWNASTAQVWPDKRETKPSKGNRDNSHSSSDGLFNELRLEDNEMLKVTKMMEQVKELIHEYANVFSSPEKAIGETSLIEFQVKLQPGAQPIK